MEYTVRISHRVETFFRLARDYDLETSFLSNHELGKRRRRQVEDAADHRGISVRETLDQALNLGRSLNSHFRDAGKPQYTHVAEVWLKPEERYACARTGRTEGHHTVWGEAADLASSLAALHPIDETG